VYFGTCPASQIVPIGRDTVAFMKGCETTLEVGPIDAEIDAPAALLFQMLGAIGQGAQRPGEHAEILERDGDALVCDFWTVVSLPFGRTRSVRTRGSSTSTSAVPSAACASRSRSSPSGIAAAGSSIGGPTWPEGCSPAWPSGSSLGAPSSGPSATTSPTSDSGPRRGPAGADSSERSRATPEPGPRQPPVRRRVADRV